MFNWITIPSRIVPIIYFIAFIGSWGYIVTITGNMLDASEKDIERWKTGLNALAFGIIYATVSFILYCLLWLNYLIR